MLGDVVRLQIAPSQHCAAIAVPSGAVVALGSCTHALIPAARFPPLRTSTPCAGKIMGATGGDGGDRDGGDGGDGGGAGDAQITKPPLPEANKLLDHLIVSPAAMSTLLGALLP